MEKLQLLTQETYRNIMDTFPWVVISPSIHRILAHSWEVMQLNGGYGLGRISEERQEALNKFIREFQCSGARKDSTVHNFTDTYNHMWDRSRPSIIKLDRKIQRRAHKLLVMTEIETLIDSLFLKENMES